MKPADTLDTFDYTYLYFKADSVEETDSDGNALSDEEIAAAEELALIWNRYYRTKESHKRAVIGSGLGLSIVQSILEKHGAEYGVDSQEGVGTTFWFECDVYTDE